MSTSIIIDTAIAFRTNRGEATGAARSRPEHHDEAPGSTFRTGGAFTQQELRDLVLHWMG